jgi:hypothetical protein
MKKSIIYIIILINSSLYAQIPMDSVMSESENKFYFIWEKDFYILSEISNKKFSVELNDSLIDDIDNFAFNDYFFDIKSKKLFFSYNEARNSYLNILDFNTKKFEHIQLAKDIFVYNLQKNTAIYKTINSKKQEIVIYDLSSRSNIKRIDLNNVFTFSGFDLYNVLYFGDANEILVNTGVYEDGALFDAEYYLLNIENNSFNKYSFADNLKSVFSDNGMNINYYSLNKKYAIIGSNSFSSDYSFHGKVLQLYDFNIKGFVFNNGNLSRLILLSTINNKNKNSNVAIQYENNINIEVLMSYLYHNKKISKSEISYIKKFNLSLLQNMIYAKHNLAFDDNFLNAYFNLYSFYRSKSNSRLENVDHLLTDVDKKNLKIIESVLQKK